MRREVAAVGALVALAVALTWGSWGSPPQWKPDALFYEAQLLEVQGVPHEVALHRVFTGPLAEPRLVEERTKPEAVPRLTDPAWVDYSARFYRRRWVFPALGAALEPAFGTDALQLVSLTAFVLVGPLLYALLRRRFSVLVSLAAAAACVALPPLRYWALQPQTDSLAVAVEALALLLAVVALERGRWWLVPWGLALLALGFTRDASVVLVAAVAWVALRERTRRSVEVLGVGLLAAAPPPLLFGAPLREAMTYTFGDFLVPSDTSWHAALSGYPKGVRRVQIHDVDYLVSHPLTALAAVGGLVALFALRRRGDTYFTLMRGAAVGALVVVAILPNYTAMRLELAFVPVIAVGLALLVDAALAAVRRRRPSASGARPRAT